jgi:hypothetical protein
MSSSLSRLSESEEKDFDLLSRMPKGTRNQEQERRLDELLEKKCPSQRVNEDFEGRELTDEEKQAFQNDIRSAVDFGDDEDVDDKSDEASSLITRSPTSKKNSDRILLLSFKVSSYTIGLGMDNCQGQ